MATLGRRKFIISSGAATLGLSLATLITHKRANALGLGELVPDPDGILDLPMGFSYKIIESKGDDMDDGHRVPGRPDGMACFVGSGNTLILMRNHEVTVGDNGNGPYKGGQSPVAEAYEPAARGGVTRLLVDSTSYDRVSSNLVLVGTNRNCCGGPSPWGWLSCEENTDINGNYRHGYVFQCATDAESVQEPHRIDGYGRFNHEAVAIDPSNNYAYLTEDRGNSCLYRFVPTDMASPFEGKLQALKVVGQDEYKTTDMAEGEIVDIEWVDIDSPDPDSDTVRDEGHNKGAAIIVRGEGIWFFEGQVYVVSTSGGQIGTGQIFRLIDGDAPTLEVVVQSTDTDVIEKPDNITVAPWGELFVAEDGDNGNFIRWVTAEGEVLPFARNAKSSGEFAGVCFSPDGNALFFNMQTDGLTLVVTGPFPMVVPPSDGDGETTTEDTTGDDDSTGGTTGDGDTAGGTTGDGDTTTDSGYETSSSAGSESGDGTSDGESESDGDDGCNDGWGDEYGGEDCDTSTAGAGGWLREEAGNGCNVAANQSPGVAGLMTGLALVGLGALIRDPEDE